MRGLMVCLSAAVLGLLLRTQLVCPSQPPALFYTLWAVPQRQGCGRVLGESTRAIWGSTA